MRVFAPAAFRDSGIDYPYGWQDVADDTLARRLKAANKVFEREPDQRLDQLLSSNIVEVGAPTGDPLGDYNLLMNAIASAGVGGRLMLPFGKTFTPMAEIVPLSRQVILGNHSILKLPTQVVSALTAPVVMGNSVFWPTLAVPVASTTGFQVGQRVALHDATTAGQITSMHVKGTVQAISQGTVYVQFEIGTGQQVAQTTNTSTWAETALNSYTWPAGALLVTVTSLLASSFGLQRIGFVDLELDGNAANNPYANRWEVCPLLDLRADRSMVRNLWAYNAPSDGVYVGCTRPKIETVWIDKPNSMGFHIGAGGTAGGQRGVLRDLWVDTPGMGTPAIGHYGGYTALHPAYAAIGFSRNTDHLVFEGLHLSNDYGVQGSTWGQAIGCITGGDNYALSFTDVFVRDFNKGIGAIQMVRSSGTSSAPGRIDFKGLHLENCGPITPGTFNQWEVSSIGCSSGSALPHTDEVTISDADFLDSPLIIQDANATLNDVKFRAAGSSSTDNSTTSSLAILGSALANCRVMLNNVVSRRNVVTSSNNAQAPAATGYAANIYVQGATVRGDNVLVRNGALGMRAQSGADVEITNFKAEDNYNYGAASFSGSTRLVLPGARIRVSSGFTPASTYGGVDCSSSISGAYTAVTNPDIEIVTTAAGQYGVRLPAAAGANCSVVGGKVKVSGTSTTPIASGGANGVGVVSNVTLSNAFTPGAGETSVGNQVVATV